MNKDKTTFAPKDFIAQILQSFSDKERPAYGQVATLSPQQGPQVRTVHFYYLDAEERLAFPTHTASPKWLQLQADKRLSACYYDVFRLRQLRWQGEAFLVDRDAEQFQEERREIWLKVRAMVREAYWQDFVQGAPKRNFTLDDLCPTFGIVVCDITSWDIWQMDVENYQNSRRFLCRKPNGEWHTERVSPLHHLS